MAVGFEDYDAAIRAFWAGRNLQQQKQFDSGRIDSGTRGAVTGGLHLNALQELIARQFEPLVDLGVRVRSRGKLTLPGYYRRTKNWDIVVTYGDILVAAIECKSQVGSFGNNFNNRTEEAIGNAVDLWRANAQGFFGAVKPWLGFVFVLEYADASVRVQRDTANLLYNADRMFDNSSYADRYQLLFQRLVRDGLYDAACFIRSVNGEGIYDEPLLELSTANLTAAIAERVSFIQELGGSA
ncbi:PaeR7I family type II restriction endonuclease [Kutzneria sp. NPDC051319]|uniref:PaeR7I family type II restriction endonuclease n=1 Tax=Kutzneria sp. NPDC051319 TaxID=3155047 RepID=UPI0034494323